MAPSPPTDSVQTGDTAGALDVAREIVFSPLKHENLADRATRRIAEAIGLGLLEVGERLPAEADLAERFGVSPMTLRDSLNTLRSAGYLETRRGRGGGTFVKRATPQPTITGSSTSSDNASADEIRDLTELRVAISGAAAALAADRALDFEIDELAALVEEMAAETRFARFRLIDSRFHIAIASASRSRRLTEAETSIQAEAHALLARGRHTIESIGVTNGEHRAIVAALAERDPLEARRATERHARATGEYLVLQHFGEGE